MIQEKIKYSQKGLAFLKLALKHKVTESRLVWSLHVFFEPFAKFTKELVARRSQSLSDIGFL